MPGNFLHRATVVPVLLLGVLCLSLIPSPSPAQTPRRVNAGLLFSYTVLDGEFFGMDGAFGNDILFRCELFGNIYHETRLGIYLSGSDGYDVTCFNGQTGALVFSTHFLPFRPFARAALGLFSANPPTATPTDSYRPSQTTFYFVLGLGTQRYVRGDLLVEAGADVMFTPYEYIIYDFDRQAVTTRKAQFTHFAFTLGASYTF